MVPKGSFMMGTPITEVDRSKGEDLIHRVIFCERLFAVGRFTSHSTSGMPVLPMAVATATKADDHGVGRGRLPARGINFEAAKLYLAWLSKRVGRTYRLPSEFEREYFARAGTTTPFWFGKTISSQNANYSASIPYADGPRGIDSKGPAVWSIPRRTRLDFTRCTAMSGNGPRTAFQQALHRGYADRRLAVAEGDCNKRMVRGGTWDWSADNRARAIAMRSNTAAATAGVVRTLNVPNSGLRHGPAQPACNGGGFRDCLGPLSP